MIFYDARTLRRLGAIIREVAPDVVLTHSPQDYMEDHMNTSRLAVSAAFARAMPGYRTAPPRKATERPVTIYHANPHGLRDQLRRRVHPEPSSTHQRAPRKQAALLPRQTGGFATPQGMNIIRLWTTLSGRWGRCRDGSGTRKMAAPPELGIRDRRQ